MKKTVLILVLVLICLTVGCREQIQPAESNNSILEEIAVPIHGDLELPLTYPDGRYKKYDNNSHHTLANVKMSYNVNPTQMDENTLYVVFKNNNDTIGNYYIYAFFYYNPSAYENAFVTLDGEPDPCAVSISRSEDDFWFIVSRIIRISKRLSQNDFSNITIGSSISDVEAVNPVTSIAIPPYNKVWGRDYSLSFDTFHYTDNGILRITFSRETVNDEYRVSEIELNSSFEVDRDDGYSHLEGQEPLVKLKINPEHIPN